MRAGFAGVLAMRLLIVLRATALACPVLGQPVRQVDLDDFRLESGSVLRDCHMGLRAFGSLNPQRSNVLLHLT